MFRKILGVLLIIGGIVVGIWLGVFVMFIGGLTQLINAIKNHFDTVPMVWGIVKILCAGFVGWISFFISAIVGWALLQE